MPYDIEPRLLRAFAAVAETLHFTQAAGRLFVAQQALSRDIRRLERELDTELFLRSTRRVELTADGERLLPYARRVLAAQDALIAEFTADRPLLVDIGASVGTPSRVLAEARRAAPGTEMFARFHSGLTGAAAEILAGRLDVSFGRVAGLDPAVLARLHHVPVGYERMAVVLPHGHRLAGLAEVPLDALAGETLYAAAGNAATAEWTDLAERLFAGRSIGIAAPLPPIEGPEEFIRVMRKLGRPVLASMEFIEMPGAELRPIVDPVPLAPVSMVWRRGLRHPALKALHAAVRKLSALERPAGSWLPECDAALTRPPRTE